MHTHKEDTLPSRNEFSTRPSTSAKTSEPEIAHTATTLVKMVGPFRMLPGSTSACWTLPLSQGLSLLPSQLQQRPPPAFSGLVCSGQVLLLFMLATRSSEINPGSGSSRTGSASLPLYLAVMVWVENVPQRAHTKNSVMCHCGWCIL